MDKEKSIFYGWWVVTALYMVGMLGPTARYSLSALSPFIRNELLWTKTQVGLAFSIHLWIYSFMVLIAGWMIDHLGGRRTVFIGGIMLLITLGLLSRTSSLWYFYTLYGAILPFGVALTHFIPTQAIARKWFEKKAGLVGGIMATAFAIGVGLFSPLLTNLGGSIGWRMTWLICAISFGALIMLSTLLIRDTPESMGLHPDGISEISKKEEVPSANAEENTWKLKEAITTPSFWLLAAGFALISIPLQGLLANIVMWAVDLGSPVATAGLILTFFTLPSVPAKIGGGLLGDKFGKKNVLIFGHLACMLIMIYAWLGVHTAGDLILFVVLLGVGYGVSLGLFAPYLGDMFGRASIGSLLGLMTLGHTFVGGFGSLIWGWLSDLSGSYNSACFLSAICYAMVVVAFILIKPPVRKQHVTG